MSNPGEALHHRLDAIDEHLAKLAVAESDDPSLLTDPDDATGERWERGQVWAHVGEFVGYWLVEAARVVQGYQSEPVPFGRIKSDEGRLTAIERDRHARPEAMLWEVRDDITALRDWLSGLDASAWASRGAHQTRGVMTLEAILEDFVVGHLEEHATQLESLRHSDVASAPEEPTTA